MTSHMLLYRGEWLDYGLYLFRKANFVVMKKKIVSRMWTCNTAL